MAGLTYHGGRCCGMRHIFSFLGNETREDIENLIRLQTRQNVNQGMLIEVVLTNGQCRSSPRLPVMLQEVGFKLVNRFRNPNTGNICNVFHYNKSPRSLTSRLPFPLVEAIEQ